MDSNVAAVEAADTSCLNCDAEVPETFCGACGQRALEGRLTFRGLGSILAARFLEGGLARTLIDSIRSPGGVIRRYVDGQRKRYMNPLSYLLIGVALSLVLLEWVIGASFGEEVRQGLLPLQDALGWTEAQMDAAMALQEAAVQRTSLGMVLLAFPFAVLLRMFFPKGEANLAELSVFALFSFGHAFFLDLITFVFFLFTDSLQLHSLLTALVFVVTIGASAWGFFGRSLWAVTRAIAAFLIAYITLSTVMYIALIVQVQRLA